MFGKLKFFGRKKEDKEPSPLYIDYTHEDARAEAPYPPFLISNFKRQLLALGITNEKIEKMKEQGEEEFNRLMQETLNEIAQIDDSTLGKILLDACEAGYEEKKIDRIDPLVKKIIALLEEKIITPISEKCTKFLKENYNKGGWGD